jgi:FAD/FMN-containing dehydrogenase
MTRRINRRRLLKLKTIAGLPFAKGFWPGAAKPGAPTQSMSRVRPGDPAWPSDTSWEKLNRDVGGRLIKVRSPLSACVGAPFDAACAEVFRELKNPYYLGDEAGLTQSLGWVGAWTSEPSVYAVAAETPGHVAAAVNFARTNNLRLVVKGGGHSYQGTSNAAGSLLVWTRRMDSIVLREAFVAAGCEKQAQPQPAVSVAAGAIWGRVYNEVMVKAGRYVQGGGCLTVGVAGLVNGGGFGSLSKAFGLAAGNLIEAEVVTADGDVKLASACTNSDLFWALKGGGAGFGVVTRLTLRTHDLPEAIGAVIATIDAASDDAYRRLISKALEFYAQALFNPQWGEQFRLQRGARLWIQMLFQGLDREQAEAVWRPFFDWVAASPRDFRIGLGPQILAAPGRKFWDPATLRQIPGVVLADDRPGAPPDNIFWTGNRDEAGQVIHASQSVWLPASLLAAGERDRLVNALTATAEHSQVELYFNKGLAGGSAEAIDDANYTAMNAAVIDAFALAICGAGAPPAYPGVPGHELDAAAAKRDAAAVDAAMNEIRKLPSRVASYVWETDYFQPNWQDAFWGDNYARLRMIKDKYDPEGLFFLHHGVGSEDWSADGFTPAEWKVTAEKKREMEATQ